MISVFKRKRKKKANDTDARGSQIKQKQAVVSGITHEAEAVNQPPETGRDQA